MLWLDVRGLGSGYGVAQRPVEVGVHQNATRTLAGIAPAVPEFRQDDARDRSAFGVSRRSRVCGDGSSRGMGPQRGRAGDAHLLLLGSALERGAHLYTGRAPERCAVLSLSIPAAGDDLPDSLLPGRHSAEKTGWVDRPRALAMIIAPSISAPAIKWLAVSTSGTAICPAATALRRTSRSSPTPCSRSSSRQACQPRTAGPSTRRTRWRSGAVQTSRKARIPNSRAFHGSVAPPAAFATRSFTSFIASTTTARKSPALPSKWW